MNKNYPTNKTLSQLFKKNIPFPSGIDIKHGQTICEGVDLRIDANGTWFHNGSAIKKVKIVKLFSKALHRDDDHLYWLITPSEICKIEVEDAPFRAIELILTNQGPNQIIQFRTNIDTIINLNKKHSLRVEINEKTLEPSPYVSVSPGLEAKLLRSVFYELVNLGVEFDSDNEVKFGVWSENTFFKLADHNHLQGTKN